MFRVGKKNKEINEFPVEMVAGDSVVVVATKADEDTAHELANLGNYEQSARKIVSHAYEDGEVKYVLEQDGNRTTVGPSDGVPDFQELVESYWENRSAREEFPYFMVAEATEVRTRASFGDGGPHYVTVFDGEFAGLITSRAATHVNVMQMILNAIEQDIDFAPHKQ